MKSIKYIVAMVFIYFGGVKLIVAMPMDVLIDLPFTSIQTMSILPYYLSPMIGMLEILLGVSLLNRPWSRYSAKLVGVYIPMILVFLLLDVGVSFTDSPFVLSWDVNAIISHICLLGIIFMLIRQELKDSALRA